MSPFKQLRLIRKMVHDEPLAPELFKSEFQVLVSIILSSRTKEEKTIDACKRLFKKYPTARKMAKAKPEEIEKLIYGVGFYRAKAKYLIEVAKKCMDGMKYDRKWLESLPGVGRKTASVFLQICGKDEVAVDTHVHRIANRLGWVETKKPEETEKALKKLFPRKAWKEINPLLVRFGRQVCKPTRPLCDKCLLRDYCKYSRASTN